MSELLIVKLGSSFAELTAEGGDFDDWIVERLDVSGNVTVTVVRPYLEEPLPPAGRSAGIVVTGSHAMVTERAAWSERTGRWLREVVAAGVPLLGICYGHQLLAEALGGEAGFLPGGPEFGTVASRLCAAVEGDRLFGGLPKVLEVQTSHSQSVLRLPEGAVRLAESDRDPNHAFRVGETAWGVQFHPEFDARVTAEYVRQCADLLDEPERLAAEVRETPESESLLRRFGQITLEG